MKEKIKNAFNKYQLKDFCIVFFAWTNNEERISFTEHLLSIKCLNRGYCNLDKINKVEEDLNQSKRKFLNKKCNGKKLTIDDFMRIIDVVYLSCSVLPVGVTFRQLLVLYVYDYLHKN